MKWALIVLSLTPSVAFAESNRDRALAAEASWERCVVGAATRMKGKAGAETIATAAFSKCQVEEDEFRSRLRQWSKPFGIGDPMPPYELDRQLGVQRERIRGLAIAALLD